MQTTVSRTFTFGEFEIDVTRRVLFKDGKAVRLHSKSMDLLLVLIDSPGEVITKSQLLDRVWENQFVEEKNLSVHIAALRKVLGEAKSENRYIATVPGTGYRFVADIRPTEVCETSVADSFESAGAAADPDDETVWRNGHTVAAKTSLQAPPARNYRWWMGVAAVFVLAGVAGGFFVYRWRSEAAQTPPEPSKGVTARTKRLTTSGKVLRGGLSDDGKLYAYVVGDGEMRSLWLGHVGGSEGVCLRPPEKGSYTPPTFSPDGSSLYFSFSPPDMAMVLYRLPVLGGVAEEVLKGVEHRVAISPDGTRMAFVKFDEPGGVSRLMVAGADGSSERELSVRPMPSSFAVQGPSWSPDGNTLAIAASDDDPAKGDVILGISVGDGSVTRLAECPGQALDRITWLKDGSGILALSVGGEASGDSNIWFYPMPEGAPRRITSDLDAFARHTLDVSGDGKFILASPIDQLSNIWTANADDLEKAKQITFGTVGKFDGLYGLDWLRDGSIIYSSRSGESQSIWRMKSDGSQQHPITPTGYTDAAPDVSDDGQIIVFQSTRNKKSAIWKMNADGSGLQQMTAGENEASPDLSPDGLWIAFTGEALFKMPVDGGAATRLYDAEVKSPRFSPDGRLIAVSEIDQAGGKRIIVIDGTGGDVYRFAVPRSANFRNGLKWTPDGTAITYRDWVDGLWRQPLAGGPPSRIPGLPRQKIYSYAWSRDGKRFAFAPATEIRDLVLISGYR